MKIAILHNKVAPDARKDELDTLVQVNAVSEALVRLGYDPVAVEFSIDLRATIAILKDIKPLFVFNLVESVEGRDRFLYLAPAIMDYLRLPFTGSCTEAVFASSNKLLAKQIFNATGIATPEWISKSASEQPNFKISGCYIIKSVWDHASLGLTDDSVFCPIDMKEITDHLSNRQVSMDCECFAERYIKGREFNLSIVGSSGNPKVLPPAEILFRNYPEGKPRIVNYAAKWHEDSFEYKNTVRSFDFPAGEEQLLLKLIALAQRCWKSFNLNGYARVDFRVDEFNNPWVLEINVNPCISPDSGFVAAVEKAGLNYTDVIEKISKNLVTPNQEWNIPSVYGDRI